MSATLFVEFFDTDTSSYKHRLALPLKSSGSFRLTRDNALTVQHSDGTTRFVPLQCAKQYYQKLPMAEEPPEIVLIDELLRRAEAAGFEVAEELKNGTSDVKATFLVACLERADFTQRKP